ncbi:MAG TPA: FadR family transcriptional regulator [Clostridiaceae bacterium]|nr:FadR family transcriptional regulator [Clostridiaceae bacterium]
MALSNIKKKSISDEVYKQFMNAIASGEWAPGSKIPSENELAATLGVSRISVRSALHKLASLGLVESRQGEGTFVCEISGEQYLNNLVPIIMLSKPDLKHLLEFRMIFDCEMAGLAAMRADEEKIEKLKANLAHHKQLSHDIKAAAECDFEFHYLIAQASANPLLTKIYMTLKDIFLAGLYDIVAVMGTDNAFYYHNKIIDCIEARDSERARAVMREHIIDTIDAALGKRESPDKTS